MKKTSNIAATALGWLPAEPPGSRADGGQLASRMADVGDRAAARADQAYRPVSELPKGIDLDGPVSYRTAEEKPKRARPGLTEGMRNRLLTTIAQTRGASAEARAHGDRRQELIQDLVKAKQMLRTFEADQERRAWLDGRRPTMDPDYVKELDVRRERVTRLQAGLDAVTAQQTEAAQRCGRLKAVCAKIAGHGLGKGQATWGDPSEVDIDSLEERCLGQ